MRHIIPAQEFESYPLAWENIFRRRAPLAVEIGFGNGEYLVNWAGKEPGWNFVGIEQSSASVERLQKRLIKAQIGNVRILRDDAAFALRELFPGESIDAAVMNFPDPWPKERHSRRRLLKPSFIEVLAFVLKLNTFFELVTDQVWLAEDTSQLFSESNYFRTGEIEKNPRREIATKYERKWRRMGRDSYRVRAKKINQSKIKRIMEDASMPHFVIKNRLTAEQIARNVGREYSMGDSFFIIKDIFTHLSGEAYLLKTITRDGDYQQKFFLFLTKHKSDWLLKLDDTTRPYRTQAVKLAVRKTGEMLSGAGNML